jgi:proliferating cell nuclear antigen
MFEAKLKQGVMLKKIFDSIKDLIEDVNIECTPTGLYILSMDTTHNTLVSVHIRHTSFVHYRCDQSIKLGLNLKTLSNMLKSVNNNDTIIIKTHDDSDTANFLVESPGCEKTADFELRLKELSEDVVPMPDNNYNATLKLPSSEFHRITKDLSSIGDAIAITLTTDFVKFSSVGHVGSSTITIKANEKKKREEEVSIKIKDTLTVGYTSKNFNCIAKATTLCSQVTISVSEELPLIVEYNIEEIGIIKFHLAARYDFETMP